MILDDILKVLKNSKNIAYVENGKSYTYRELYKYVCNIYLYLQEQNLNKAPVIVYGHKEIFMKATFLACSFAGMAYVPIDITTPEERVKLIIDQVNPGLIITSKIEKIMKREKFKEIENIYMTPEDIYYIIFTSGSTGIPKGVKISYKNIDSCVKWLRDISNAKEEIILNQANFSFDLSVADLYLSLITGSTHYITNEKQYNLLFQELKKSNASIAVMTPSYADLLLLDKSFSQNLMPKLKKIIFCGEKLLSSTVKKLYERFENLKIINCYGPTECTFAVTSIEIPRTIPDEIPVGIAKKDVNIYIENGEIIITGESVAKGYLNNNNNKSFIKFNGENAYLTGDLGYIKNGVLYYKCRKDKQIKYKGYRIELTDIEQNLQNLEYIEKAIVIAKKNQKGNVTNIIAFIKTKEKLEKIKNELKLKLPDYMIPKIKIIEKFPLNNNGKCDEKKLMEM